MTGQVRPASCFPLFSVLPPTPIDWRGKKVVYQVCCLVSCRDRYSYPYYHAKVVLRCNLTFGSKSPLPPSLQPQTCHPLVMVPNSSQSSSTWSAIIYHVPWSMYPATYQPSNIWPFLRPDATRREGGISVRWPLRVRFPVAALLVIPGVAEP